MDKRPEDERRGKFLGMGLALGIAIGAGLVILPANLALGIAMGTGVGVLSEPVSPRATKTKT